MNKKIYWKIRNFFRNVIFFVKKILYKGIQKAFEEKKNSNHFKCIIKDIVIKALYISVLLFCFSRIDAFLLSQNDALILNDGWLISIVVGSMGIAGVILGLYYANISSIFSSSYSNAPKILADAYQRDVINNKCIYSTITYIIFCVFVLGEQLISINISYATGVAYIFLTLKLIITFSISGNRAYQLTSSFRLAENAIIDIRHNMNLAATGKFKNDNNFQNHYKRQVQTSIEILKEIQIYNSDVKKEFNSSIESFISNNVALLLYYQKVKHKIPFNSMWFVENSEYRQWHNASHSELNSAILSPTLLSEVKVKDLCWVEKEIFNINKKFIVKIGKEKDYNSLYRYLLTLAKFVDETPYGNSLDVWLKHLEDIKNIILEFESNDDSDPDFLAVSDAFCAVVYSLVTHLCLYISNNNFNEILEESVECVYGKIDCSKRSYVYLNNDIINNLRKKIKVEFENEGKFITPSWYIKQFVAKNIYEHLNNLCSYFIMVDNMLIDMTQKLNNQKKYCASALSATRLIEINQKVRVFDTIGKIEQSFDYLRKVGKDVSKKWFPTDLEAFSAKVKEIHFTFPKIAMKYSGQFVLSTDEKREKRPDLLGYSYNVLCEVLIESIANDDYNDFENNYKDFLFNMMFYRDYVVGDIQSSTNYNENWKLYLLTFPFNEFAVISSLAILWGEFNKDDRWKKLVMQETDAFFSKMNPDQKNAILQNFILSASSVNDIRMGIKPRSITVTRWEQTISRKIIASEKFECVYEGPFGYKRIKSDSKVIQAFCGHMIGDLDLNLNNSGEIYLVVCLNPLLEDDKKFKSRFKWEEKLNEEE